MLPRGELRPGERQGGSQIPCLVAWLLEARPDCALCPGQSWLLWSRVLSCLVAEVSLGALPCSGLDAQSE